MIGNWACFAHIKIAEMQTHNFLHIWIAEGDLFYEPKSFLKQIFKINAIVEEKSANFFVDEPALNPS